MDQIIEELRMSKCMPNFNLKPEKLMHFAIHRSAFLLMPILKLPSIFMVSQHFFRQVCYL